jgi:hypothetical protein
MCDGRDAAPDRPSRELVDEHAAPDSHAQLNTTST